MNNFDTDNEHPSELELWFKLRLPLAIGASLLVAAALLRDPWIALAGGVFVAIAGAYWFLALEDDNS